MFAICIVSYNRPQEIVHLLESISHLEGRSLLREIIIIDNASTEDMSLFTDYLATQPGLPITFFQNTENVGVSRARNQAVAAATASYICFVDDDSVIADKRYLLKLQEIWTHAPHYTGKDNEKRPLGIIACRVHDFYTHTPPPHYFPHKSFRAREKLPHFFTYYFLGSANVIERTLFLRMGGFPEDFFYAAEEYDLGYKVLKAGYSIFYTADIIILHKEHPAGRLARPHKYAMLWLHKTKVAFHHFPLPYLLSTTFIWFLYFMYHFPLRVDIAFATFRKIIRYIRNHRERRQVCSSTTMQYLRAVKARLWY